jgi:hypothetical protein
MQLKITPLLKKDGCTDAYTERINPSQNSTHLSGISFNIILLPTVEP